jgi:hypothetical protein
MHEQGIRAIFNREKYIKLALSLVMDLLGMASFAVPGVFGMLDLFWGPVSGIVTFMMYGSTTGAVGGFINAVEEMLPVSDFLPTVTLVWIYTYIMHGEETYKKFVDKYEENNPVIREVDYVDLDNSDNLNK